jgi:uncharacterized protein YbjT (DUF2867 family)
MIAVMGAAGNVGSKVADLLVRQGQPVRALEHRRRLDELGRRAPRSSAATWPTPGTSVCCSRTSTPPWWCCPTS